MEKRFINLNHDDLKLALLPFGKTQNIELKIGKKLYYCDVEKGRNYVILDFYKKICPDRTKQSKYGSASIVLGLQVKSDSVLSRFFFEDIKEIEKACRIYRNYHKLVKFN